MEEEAHKDPLLEEDDMDAGTPQQRSWRPTSRPGTPASMIALSPSKGQPVASPQSLPYSSTGSAASSGMIRQVTRPSDLSARDKAELSDGDQDAPTPPRSVGSSRSGGGLHVQTAYDPFSARHGSPINRSVPEVPQC